MTAVQSRLRTSMVFGLLLNGTVSTVLATSVACLLGRTAVCVAIRGGSSQPRNARILAQPGRHEVAPAVLQRSNE
jgi:hypothetical protein